MQESFASAKRRIYQLTMKINWWESKIHCGCTLGRRADAFVLEAHSGGQPTCEQATLYIDGDILTKRTGAMLSIVN